MQLKTGTGVQYVTLTGPECCGTTQTPTQLNFTDLFNNILTVNYSLCNYEPTNITYSPEGVDCNVSPDSCKILEPLQEGAAYCEQNDRTGLLDTKQCYSIKKLGPREGAVIFTQRTEATGVPVPCSGDRCPGYAYYGFGNDIYRIDVDVPDPATITCNPECNGYSLYADVPRPKSVTIDDFVQFIPDGCGNGIIRRIDNNDETTCLSSKTPIFIVPYNDGILDTTQASKVVSGSSEGAVLYANPSCCIIGGVYVCSYKCGLR